MLIDELGDKATEYFFLSICYTLYTNTKENMNKAYDCL